MTGTDDRRDHAQDPAISPDSGCRALPAARHAALTALGSPPRPPVGEPLAASGGSATLAISEAGNRGRGALRARSASAMIVIIGLVPEAVGKALASPIQTPGVSWSSPHGLATEVAGSAPIRQLPIWWAEKTACSCGASEHSSSPRQERVEVLAAAPGERLAAERHDSLRARGLVDPGHRLQAGAEVGDVELVGEPVARHGVPRRVDVDPAVAAVADQRDQQRGVAQPGHLLLVLAAGVPGRRRRPRSRSSGGRPPAGSRGRRRARRTRGRARTAAGPTTRPAASS